MDHNTFTDYMKLEEKTLDKYQAESAKTFGKTFKVSVELKEQYKKKMGETPIMYARDDYFNYIKKANDEVLATYDIKKRPKSVDSKFNRKSSFEIGRGIG